MRYLVAVDGWEPSRRALSLAVEQATEAGATVDVAHVVDENGGDPEAVEQIRSMVEEVVEAVEADADAEVDVEVHVLEADKRHKPATRVGLRLLEFAEEEGHDLLYLGNEHTGTAERMIVGSVSGTAIEDRSLPVVLVP